MVVEIRNKDFELLDKGKSTGQYMRGEVEGGVIGDRKKVNVTLFLDGQTYYVKSSDLFVVEE